MILVAPARASASGDWNRDLTPLFTEYNFL
jgi:hypothetical protein